MLFRTSGGNLINIIKTNYINDKLYYEKLLELNKPIPKLENAFYNKYNKQSNK